MELWRISNYITLDGVGGLRASARWHRRGHAVVYCAPNPATALLEVLVHAEIDLQDLPVAYKYLKIASPDDLTSETVKVSELPDMWKSDPSVTQSIGNAWLVNSRSAVLFVPSVIVPQTFNTLVNPQHADAAAIRIETVLEHQLDERLA